MRTWQYRSFLVDGKTSPVCGTMTFIYSQPAPAQPRTP
jgi:hypothetical protein